MRNVSVVHMHFLIYTYLGVRSGLSLLLVTCNPVQPATWTGGWCLNQLPPLTFLVMRKVACRHIGKARPVKAWMSLLEPTKTFTQTCVYVCILRYLSNFHTLYIKCIYIVFLWGGVLNFVLVFEVKRRLYFLLELTLLNIFCFYFNHKQKVSPNNWFNSLSVQAHSGLYCISCFFFFQKFLKMFTFSIRYNSNKSVVSHRFFFFFFTFFFSRID